MEKQILTTGRIAPGLDASHVGNNQGWEAKYTLTKWDQKPTLTFNPDSSWHKIQGLEKGTPPKCKDGQPRPELDDYRRCKERSEKVFWTIKNVCKAPW